ncbi:hypothetical protein CEY16_05565 [Halalkalibacillus sediminis]|uniref:HTH cro/C1-type domain-containing protein n=1 Tax=Halalkalibacillus sediminis TaxID=2018042 RepID=A0A2I0QY16_9BACI|nr:helix-turn-helix transcriptional regulator [Halalkalibacillus sediminis]PKR79209.1 hypothetical protein CEY16_05565 [Halalkalibacillus sediminis]
MKEGTSRAGKALRAYRLKKGKTQQQLSFDLFSSRELITKMERGERKIGPEVTERIEDPFVALERAGEYAKAFGAMKLDGLAVDLNRTTTYLKTKEELQEALDQLSKTDVTRAPKFVEPHEIQNIDKALQECIDVVTAVHNFVAVVCDEYNLPVTEVWNRHTNKLVARKYVLS